MSKGMTFIEIMIVIALITGISAGGVLGLSQLQTIFKLRGAADEIRSALQLGRELTLAKKDQETYQISLSSDVIILRSNSQEIVRYLTPSGIIFTPSSFTWGYAPLTGLLTGCTLPCQLTMTANDNVEAVIVHENGLVN